MRRNPDRRLWRVRNDALYDTVMETRSLWHDAVRRHGEDSGQAHTMELEHREAQHAYELHKLRKPKMFRRRQR